MKNDFRPKGYETCVLSRKRQHASWRVFETCGNPLARPDHKLPYPTVCNTCSYYREDQAALKRRRSRERTELV